MADAPAGGGGNAWTAVEIIVVIILGFALLSRITGKPITPIVPSDTTTASQTTTTQPQSGCAVVLTRPKPLELIGGYTTISGALSNCAIPNDKSFALTAVIIDANGRAVSNTVTIPRSYYDLDNRMPFTTTISLTSTPTTATGYVLVVPAINDGIIVSARQPVKFR